MIRKILSILALLLFVSGAYAQSTITVYVTNAVGWNNMYIYYWGSSNGSSAEIPGAPMDYVYTNGSNQKVYKATIPNDVDGILFTDGTTSKMTEDITSKIADGAWWRVNSTTNNGKYEVEYLGLRGICGDGVTWTLSNGTLTISYSGSGTGAMTDYTYSGSTSAPWSSYINRTSINNIIIGDGVTHIGNSAFNGFTILTSAAIPDNVTSIGNNAFSDCSALKSVTIGGSVRSIGSLVFQNCRNLASIVLPPSVTSIGNRAFLNCTSLASITLNSNPGIESNAFENIKTGATITMNLTVNKAAEGEYWTTFYNFHHSFEAASGTQIFKAALEGTSLKLTELETDKIIRNANAVILKSDASPIVLTRTTTYGGNEFTSNSLKGVSSADGLTADGHYFVLNKGTQGVGFYRMTSGKKIGVGKAYLYYSGALAREFFGFEESTGIDDVRSMKEDFRGDVFDLQGRRVENPTKGIYIINGKKTVIK